MLPTPAVAHLTAALDADLGVMLSASHNPMPDNGIKLFSRGGHKLPDAVEAAVERRRDRRRVRLGGAHRPTGRGIGRVRDLPDAGARYADHLLAAVPGSLAGLTVVVDCAHGAASALAPEVYRRAGATVHVIGAEPDGWNINDGVGSTHLGPVRDRGPRARGRPRAWPTTATPTAAWRSPPTASWSTATRSWPSARWACTSPAR